MEVCTSESTSDLITQRDEERIVGRVVESGQPIDELLTDKLLSITGGAPSKNLDRDLKVSGLIVLSIAPGLVLMGWFMSLTLAEELLYIMLGVSALLVCLAFGLFGAAHVVHRWFSDEDSSQSLV